MSFINSEHEQEEPSGILGKPETTTSGSKVDGGVAANCKLSVETGIDILKKGGSAADAAIAAVMIDGLCNPQSMGLGGGFLCTYYHAVSGKVQCLNAREYAPMKASQDMWVNRDYLKNNQCYDLIKRRSTVMFSTVPKTGGLSVGVPGELQGYWDLHQRYGKLRWEEVLEPAIYYCRNGIPVTEYCGAFINNMKLQILQSPSLKEIFVRDPSEELVKFGDRMYRPQLAKTLELVAKSGPSVLYKGILSYAFVKDIRDEGGIMTIDDLHTYKTAWVDPVVFALSDNLTAYSVPPPGSGPVLQLILNVVFGIKDHEVDPEVRWLRLVETYKHAFGFRCRLEGPTKDTVADCIGHMDASCVESIREKVLNTQETIQEVEYYNDVCFSSYVGGGTGSVCVLAPDGDAISITSSINSAYGAMFASPSTGIILNNHMMDFNLQKNSFQTNEVEPEKQPLSSMSPTIILNKKDNTPRLIIGAAGGPKIITVISQIILDTLLYNVPLEEAIDKPRLHHQLKPNRLFFEEDFPYLSALKAAGHYVKRIRRRREDGGFLPYSSSASVIECIDGHVVALGDKRRDGWGATMNLE